MTTIATHTSLMTGRQLRALARQPAYLVISLIQPVIWLFLFGSLFRKVVELPGFGTSSYLDYLVPGVVIMSALSSSMWSGMTVLEEIDRGVMDRFLVLPLHRSAIINASVIMQSLMITVQSLIIVALGWAAGAHYPGGVAGVLVLIAASVLIAIVFSAFSNTIGMLARQRETIIGINTFLLLPLTFLSTAFMVTALMPHWMRTVAAGNPVNWALVAGRSAMSAAPDSTRCSSRAAAWRCWPSGSPPCRCSPSAPTRSPSDLLAPADAVGSPDPGTRRPSRTPNNPPAATARQPHSPT